MPDVIGQQEAAAQLRDPYALPPFLQDMKDKYSRQNPRNMAPSPEESYIRGEILRELQSPQKQERERVEFPQMYTPEFVKEQVNQLRGRDQLATVFAMSGDKALGDAARLMAQEQTPLQFMQEAAREERGRKYQEWQANYPGQNSADRLSSLTRALTSLQPNDFGGQDYKALPARLSADIPRRMDQYEKTRELADTWRPEYQQVLGKYQSIFREVPAWFEGNGLGEILARVSTKLKGEGASDAQIAEEQRAIQNSVLWWSKWRMNYELEKGHELFGSAFTQAEMGKFRDAIFINPSADPGMVKRKLDDLLKGIAGRTRNDLRVWVPNYGWDNTMGEYEDLIYDMDRLLGDEQSVSGGQSRGGRAPEQAGPRTHNGIEFEVEE